MKKKTVITTEKREIWIIRESLPEPRLAPKTNETIGDIKEEDTDPPDREQEVMK